MKTECQMAEFQMAERDSLSEIERAKNKAIDEIELSMWKTIREFCKVSTAIMRGY